MNDADRRFLLDLARKLDDRMIHPDDAIDFAKRLIDIANTPAAEVAPDRSLEKRAMDALERLIEGSVNEAEGVHTPEYLPLCTYLLIKALLRCGVGGGLTAEDIAMLAAKKLELEL